MPRLRRLACVAADTASLAMWFRFSKAFCVATFVGFGEKRGRRNLSLTDNLRDRHVQQNRHDLELEADRIAASAELPRFGLREHALAFMLHCNHLPVDISCTVPKWL